MKINYQLQTNRRLEQFSSIEDLGFGNLRTEHMFLMDYSDNKWSNPRIVPYGPFPIAPGAISLHYGQSIFEGAKAFMHSDGELYTFRLDKNAQRLNTSADILCMPNLPEDMHIKAVHALLDVDRKWFPKQNGSCFYIRSFMFATEDALGVHSSSTYTFCVILSPSGAYYKGGFNNAIRLLISKNFHRAVSGGTGSSKAAGNYAASLRAGACATEYGADQVLYLDSTNKWIEEAGSMNHFHILKDGTVIIPEFTDTILKSITSQSIIDLACELKRDVRQEKIPLDDFIEKIKSGEIIEAGGLGTAAVISPVGEYIFENRDILTVADGKVGPHLKAMYELYTKIQLGEKVAPDGWLRKVLHDI